MSQQPPKLADRFLAWFCDERLIEDLQGDLYELYIKRRERSGKLLANILYVWWVLRSFRISALKRNQKLNNSFMTMTKNNFKIALRVLWRDKFNSSLNLLGLMIGITCFLLLGFYVKQEVSFDQFHAKKDRIYRSWLKEDYGEGQVFFNSHTPLRFESLFEDNFPEVERSVQYILSNFLVGRGENRINESVAIISPDFFEIFDFHLIEGDRERPLPTLNDIIISQEYARKYFGDNDPMGKTLSLQIGQDIKDFNVSGIFKDIRYESSIDFDLAISTENNRTLFSDRAMNAWFNVVAETYVLLKEGASIENVNSKMQDVVLSQMGDAGYGDEAMQRDQYNIGMQPLTDIHLNPDIPLGNAPVANPQYVFILGTIGLLVLIIACINYTTLSTGQSLRRSKEVGIRKVLGAHKKTLIYQYLSESILLTIIAMLIGATISYLLIPTFNRLTGTEIYLQFEWWHAGIYALLALIIGAIAGSYPALILSGFKTINILRGSNQSGGKMTAKKGMVVFQFLITVFLITTTLIMRKQIQYLQEKDLGINYEAVISTQLQANPSAQRLSKRITSGFENGQLLKARLEKYPEISEVAMGTHVFGTSGWAHLAYTDDKGVFRWFRLLCVDANYLKTFDIDILEGRGFEEGNGLDMRQSVILNKSAVEHFGLKNPLGAKLPGDEFGDHQIIGVTDDFHYSSLHSEVEPLVIVMNPMPIFMGISDGDFIDTPIPKLVFTYNGSNLSDGTDILKKEWEALFPNESWNFNFIDEQIAAQYASETRMNKLVTIATVLSIIIASLGLLGLSMLVVNSKVKEIGIRKVMGASPTSIFRLLAKGFSIQLLIAIVLSIPITIYMMNKWLDNFAYRTSIGAWLFVLSSIVALLIAFLVISYHTMRATRINPVESLRTE
ncbi:ABC transporter permease [Ekhidna sp.]|uniref:ABC transporter permease n=1 Tax=Ekhidna sp. TaxID=2608089 RepID=UPI00329866B7